MAWNLNFFGGLRAQREAESIEKLRTQKTVALLALLALRGQQGREQVCASFTSKEGGALYIGVVGAGFENFFLTLAEQLSLGEPLNPLEMRDLAASYGVEILRPDAPITTNATESLPQILRPHEGECLEAFGDKGRFLVCSTSVQGRYSLGESTTMSLKGPPIHVHEREGEVFLIRSGRFEFQLGDARIQAGMGDVVFAPRGVPHTFRVVSSEAASALVLTTPGGFDDFFREAAGMFGRDEITPQSVTTLGDKYGIRFLPTSA